MCFVILSVSFCFCLLLSGYWSDHSLRSANFELSRTRAQCYIKISQTQGVLNPWPFHFSGLIDENNCLFVFAALLQMIWCFCWRGRVCNVRARPKKLGHLRRLSGSPQVCFGQASGFACGMPSISTIFSQFLFPCKNVKDLACAPGAGFAIVRILALASLLFVQKGSRKQRPRAGILGYISAVLRRPAEKPERVHTHTQHSVLKTLQLTQRNPNTQNSFDVP